MGHARPFCVSARRRHAPPLIVELGARSGNSYAALAQAVQTAGLDRACYAVDSSSGDTQARFSAKRCFKVVRVSRSALCDFLAFGPRQLRRGVDPLCDASIDLLHIDRLHTYVGGPARFRELVSEADPACGSTVSRCECPRSATSVSGVTGMSCASSFHSFTFRHGHGLGVLAVGREDAPTCHGWRSFRLVAKIALLVSRFFSVLGDALACS